MRFVAEQWYALHAFSYSYMKTLNVSDLLNQISQRIITELYMSIHLLPLSQDIQNSKDIRKYWLFYFNMPLFTW